MAYCVMELDAFAQQVARRCGGFGNAAATVPQNGVEAIGFAALVERRREGRAELQLSSWLERQEVGVPLRPFAGTVQEVQFVVDHVPGR